MGQNALTNISNVLMKKEEYIGLQMGVPGKEPILAFINKADKDMKSGQDLRRYLKVKLRPSGGWGLVSEGGDYVAAQPQTNAEGYVTPVLVNHSIEYSTHALQALNNQKAGEVGETLGRDIEEFLDAARKRKTRMFMGRGDMVLARATAAGTSVTFTSTTDVPVRACIGDYVTAYKEATSNEERLFQALDTGTSYLGTTPLFVDDVDYDANQITFSATPIWSDDVILVPNGVSSTNMTGPFGIEAIYDTVNDSSFAWDSEDDTDCDHTDTIYNLARASYTQLNVSTVNTSGYLTLDKVQRGVGKCTAKGAAVSDLFMIMHPQQFENLTQTAFGQTVGQYKTITMAGQSLELYCVTGLGSGLIPVITDYGIKESAVLIADASKLYSAELPGSWDRDGSQMFEKKNAENGQGHAAAKIAYWNMWFNYAAIMPNTSCIIYGLST